MARRPTAFDLGGAFGDRAPLFDKAGGAAAWAPAAPSSSFVARRVGLNYRFGGPVVGRY